MLNIDKELIKSLAELLHKNALTEIEYEENGIKLRVANNKPCAQSVLPSSACLEPAKVTETKTGKDEPKSKPADGETITSPMVGVIYLAPEPDATPYIKVGDKVTKGQTLFLIEAMKTFNAIRAPKAGIIKNILVKDSQPVEYAEALAILE